MARVVAALRDPNPLVAGRGLSLLRRSGIVVETGLLAAEAARLNERFLAWARLGRPFVLLKAALTLDGRIATASGRSKWITSPAQRRQARWLRRLHDAVLVGVGTALADDPLLLPSPRTRRPFTRVVLDSRLRLPPTGPARPHGHAARARPRALVRAGPGAPARSRGGRGPGGRGAGGEGARVAARRPRGALGARGVTSLMVEGGGEVLGSFLARRLVDQVALFRAPLLLGGRGSRPAFGGPDPLDIRDALRLEPVPAEPAFPWPWPPQFELWRPRR